MSCKGGGGGINVGGAKVFRGISGVAGNNFELSTLWKLYSL